MTLVSNYEDAPLPHPEHGWRWTDIEQRWIRSYSDAQVSAAISRERSRIINSLPGGHSVDPQWVADMVRNGEAA